MRTVSLTFASLFNLLAAPLFILILLLGNTACKGQKTSNDTISSIQGHSSLSLKAKHHSVNIHHPLSRHTALSHPAVFRSSRTARATPISHHQPLKPSKSLASGNPLADNTLSSISFKPNLERTPSRPPNTTLPSPSPTIFFSDDFSDPVKSQQMWQILANDAILEFKAGYVILKDNTTGFHVWQGETPHFPLLRLRTNPFPISGDWNCSFK